jgi:glycosyltransferase involved in cell wall biosynthesis
MACGRPVVATKVGDIARMVPDFAGVLFDDPDDAAALAECVLTALSRDWSGQRIRDHVAARSWSDVASRVAAQWRMAVEPLALAAVADGAGVQPGPVSAALRGREP